MVTFLPLMVQSAVPGGLGRLLLSSGSFCCWAWAEAAGVDCVRAVAAIGCGWAAGDGCGWAEAASIGGVRANAGKMKMLSAIAEKCLPVMINVLSLKGLHYRAAGAQVPAAGAVGQFEKLTH